MVFVLFPQESLFQVEGHSDHSFVLIVELNGTLHNIKAFSTLDRNFSIESVLE